MIIIVIFAAAFSLEFEKIHKKTFSFLTQTTYQSAMREG